jgi:4Fe-4S ferredoxin
VILAILINIDKFKYFLISVLRNKKFSLNIIAEKCALCGWCAINCPFEALEFKVKGEKQTVIAYENEAVRFLGDIKIQADKCIYCKECEKFCPRSAIKVDQKPEITANKLIPLGKRNRLEYLQICHFAIEGSIRLDKNKCIYCGLCETVCPSKTIKVRKPFNGQILIKNASCNACSVCVNVCPTGAIEKLNNDIIINRNACIYCSACHRICPNNAITFRRDKVVIIDNYGNRIMHI